MRSRLREKTFPWLVAGCLCALAALPARAFDDATANRALQVAQQKLRASATNPAIPTNQYPKATTDNVHWRLVPNTANFDWVQGFFPGQLWLMYDQGRDPFWRTKADAWTRSLEVQKTQSDITQITHDMGFKFMTSFGQAYRFTGDEYYHQVALTAATTMARRYNGTVGVIDCCDWNDQVWHVPTVTDTMMDLELLFWGARNGGDAAWNDMALSHALKTARDMVRADGSTFHVVDYNSSGGIVSKGTYQGWSNTSTWARGQAWAIYGFTMAYRYTRDARMLQTAQKVTEYWLSHIPADSIPNWDFDPAAPRQKDSSAAAVFASAMLELSQYVTDPATAQRYRNAGLATLDALCSSTYLNPGSSAGILLHGVAFYRTPINPPGEDIDKSLIYGDYYFVEALSRFKLWSVPGWRSTLGFPESVQSLGTGNTGVRIIEFDVTPLSKFIDGVVGYTGSAVNVTAYSSLAMSVRMNPSGLFDVRRGGDYDKLANVPYEANTTYHVRIRADLAARTYSVWVRPPGAAEVQLADRFAFRSDAPAISDIGKVSLKSGHFNDEFRVTNHSIRAEGTPPPVEWFSTLDWARSVHDLGTGNTGLRETEFDVTPLAKPIDGVVGYTGAATSVTAYSSLAMLIRMNPDGFFDVRNGADYGASASVPYEANTPYHVRMRADLDHKTYSVWVRPPGGTEVLLANGFAFRSDAPPTSDLGKVALKSGVTETEFKVTGHLVRIPTTPAPSPAPPEPIEDPAPDDDARMTPQGDSGGGCTAVPGATFAATGLLLWLLRPGRRSRARQR